MFSKSKKPTNALGIDLDLPRMGRSSADYFTAGDSVCGSITLDTSTPTPLGTIRLRFFGCAKSNLNRAGANGSVWAEAQPWLFLQERTWTVEKRMEPGKHRWHFHVRFPRETDPAANEERYEATDKFRGSVPHALPPSMDIRTAAYALQTEAVVWYGLDVDMTELGGSVRSDPTTLLLNYTPLRESEEQAIEPSIVAKEDVFACRSVALLPGREDEVTKKLSLHDKTHSFFHRESTPTAKFALRLLVADTYAVNCPIPVYLVLEHNPDGKSTLPAKSPLPEVALTKFKVTLNAWSNVRGSSRWNGNEDTTDNKSHSLIDIPNETFKFAPIILSASEGEPNDISQLATIASGVPITWPELPALPPSFATYNILVAYTLSVEIEVMCAGKKFELDYNKNLRKQSDVFTLLPAHAKSLAKGELVVRDQGKEGYELVAEDDEGGVERLAEKVIEVRLDEKQEVW